MSNFPYFSKIAVFFIEISYFLVKRQKNSFFNEFLIFLHCVKITVKDVFFYFFMLKNFKEHGKKHCFQ